MSKEFGLILTGPGKLKNFEQRVIRSELAWRREETRTGKMLLPRRLGEKY